MLGALEAARGDPEDALVEVAFRRDAEWGHAGVISETWWVGFAADHS